MRKQTRRYIYCISASLVLTNLGACIVEEEPATVGSSEPTCEAELDITGSRTVVGENTQDATCFPSGVWTLQLTLRDQGTCQSVEFENEYVYDVTPNIVVDEIDGQEDTNGFEVVYRDNPDPDTNFLKFSADGGGCVGTFEHWSSDGRTLLLMKPFDDGATISGAATYEEFDSDQIGVENGGCSAASTPSSSAIWLVLLFAAWLWRRRQSQV